ncbi:MAG: dephospho-CoA kinase [Elusimicrobiota bacterium]|jgi:dephospho-CoA kinase|nr:dephospho-CoA kinase [Elusimicrobiota bacterium]
MILGLTGSIACGKTETAEILKSLGAYVIDADVISKKLTQKNKIILNQIRKKLGKDIFFENGDLDRKKLADIVFSNDKYRKDLEKILIPKIIKKIKEIAHKNSKQKFLVIDAPLLFETKLHKFCDKTLTISSTRANQIKRLKLRNNLTQFQIKQRIRSQISLKEKEKLSDFVIKNNDTQRNLEKRVTDFLNFLKTTY